METIREELREWFKSLFGIQILTREQERQSLFGFRSKFTPVQATYLFALLKKKYQLDLSEVENVFCDEMTFDGLVGYIMKYKR